MPITPPIKETVAGVKTQTIIPLSPPVGNRGENGARRIRDRYIMPNRI